MAKTFYAKTYEEANRKWPKIEVGRAANLIGKQINDWSVCYRTTGSRPMWVAKCKCGNYGTIRSGSAATQCCRECNSKKLQKDYSGMKFNSLTVLSEGRFYSNKKTYLKCRCECGNITTVAAGNLVSGEVKSCGCLNSKTIRKYGQSFIGIKFNHLTVIEKGPVGNHGILWKCKCDCGNECYATAYQLENGTKQSCNCLPNEQWKNNKMSKTEDLTGQTFYDLTVIDFAGTKNGSRYWTCKCKCGNLHYVATRDLTRGAVKSCGCRKYIPINIGDKFGRLTVLNKVLNKVSSNGGIIYNCRCDCGTESHFVAASNLINGTIKSCGCGRNISYNEENINSLLIENNISFIKEYKDKELNEKHHTHGRQLSYDFYVNNKYIIEYDGSQHFYAKKSGWDTEEHFKRVRKNDLIKNKYCFEHNIPLIRIPYDTEYTIEDLKLETTRFLLTPENEKEYYESREK